MRITSGFKLFALCLIAQNTCNASIDFKSTIKPAKVYGSDNQYHLVYELKIEQRSDDSEHQYVLKKIEVLDRKTHQKLSQYDHETLKPLVYFIKTDGSSINTTQLQSNGQMIVFPYISMATKKKSLRGLVHRFSFIDKKHPEQTIQFNDAAVKLSNTPVDRISSPVQGGGWLACNGPGVLSSHRFAYLNVHGKYSIAQRFAIDWIQIDENGNVFTPGSSRQLNESYLDYGVAIYSATKGTVSGVRNEFQDNEPGQIPIEVQNVDNACGNQITVQLPNGHYAHYCHLKPDSMTVKVGDQVQEGQIIAALGNSGNSMGPHLHFHLSDNKSPLGSEGLPFMISGFGLQITPEKVEEVGILDFHPSETPLMNINEPGIIKNNAMPMQNGVYYFNGVNI